MFYKIEFLFCRQVFVSYSWMKTCKRSKDRQSRSDRIADIFSNWDRDRDRVLNFGDRGHALWSSNGTVIFNSSNFTTILPRTQVQNEIVSLRKSKNWTSPNGLFSPLVSNMDLLALRYLINIHLFQNISYGLTLLQFGHLM